MSLTVQNQTTLELSSDDGTFADDVRDIGAIQKRWVSLRLSLKDLMFFVDELPNLEPGGPNGRLRDKLDALCSRGIAPSLGRFVRLSDEYPRIQIQYPCDIYGFLDSLCCDSNTGKLIVCCEC